MVVRGSVRDFHHYLQAVSSLNTRVAFTDQRKGVSSWAGPEAGLEIGNVVSPTCVPRREPLPTVLRGDVAGAQGGWSPECTGAALLSAPEAALCVCVCVCDWFSWLLEHFKEAVSRLAWQTGSLL